MRIYQGRVSDVRLDAAGQPAAWIECPPEAVPAAGQYLAGRDPGGDEPLAAVLFAAEMAQGGFLAAPPLPRGWGPGTALELRGPLGHGFHLPPGARRVALVSLDATLARLLPLLAAALAQGASVSVSGISPLPRLPSQVEASPLEDLPGVLAWADYLALEVPLSGLAQLKTRLGLPTGAVIPYAGQALILADMPCTGAGACGVCALPVSRGWKLACSDGPVFDLNELEIP